MKEQHSEFRPLAEKIARRLFTNGSQERAQRLVLTIDKPSERNLGGWCEGAAVDQIEAVLVAAYRPVAADLLAALKNLVAYSECSVNDCDIWDAARAAIARAEGSTS